VPWFPGAEGGEEGFLGGREGRGAGDAGERGENVGEPAEVRPGGEAGGAMGCEDAVGF
jgi:hypothetical protein